MSSQQPPLSLFLAPGPAPTQGPHLHGPSHFLFSEPKLEAFTLDCHYILCSLGTTANWNVVLVFMLDIFTDHNCHT